LETSSDSDKPRELTVKEINDFQIQLNMYWNLRGFISSFNQNLNILTDNMLYLLKSLRIELDLEKYIKNLKENNAELKNKLDSIKSDSKEKVKLYLDILREKDMAGHWDHDWIIKSTQGRKINEKSLDMVRNFATNLSAFNLPTIIMGREPNLFIEQVMGSEPLYILLERREKEHVNKFLDNFNEVTKIRLRIYENFWELPKGGIANIIAWDHIHLYNPNRFQEQILPSLYSALQPGGILVLNYPSIYNSDDFGVIIEGVFGAYDMELMEDLTLNMGFEILKHDIDNQILFLKKPGILNTNKASPTISTIVNIDIIINRI
jgi:hypothetical protein